MSEVRGQYLAGGSDCSEVLDEAQVEMLVQALMQIKAHGWGEVHIVVRDHRVELIRELKVHK